MRNKRIKPISFIQSKLGLKSKREVHEYLGISSNTASRYDNGLTNTELFRLIKGARSSGIKSSIKVITEYYPITLTALRVNHDFIDSTNKSNHSKLRKRLEQSRGIYVFYDSSGRAIYVGKAVRQSLHEEMKGAFNRPRNNAKDTMKIVGAKHSINNMNNPTFSQKLVRLRVGISNISAYFSAYQVDESLIGVVEALMIRGFANNLTNSRIESLK